LTVIKRNINKGVVLNLEEIKDEIRQIYGTIKTSLKDKGSDALLEVQTRKFKKQFKGT
jgi:hypothetical protein